jgi:hypothetical protein
MPRLTPSCLSRIGQGAKSSNEDDAPAWQPAWQIEELFGVGTPGYAAEIMASDAKETLRGRILNVARNVAKSDFSGFALLSRLQLNLWL